MKKIFFLGNSPLPNENEKSRPAAGLRTFQFLKPLLDNPDFEVGGALIAMPECYSGGIDEANEIDYAKNCSLTLVSKDDAKLKSKVKSLYDHFRPDAVVSVNTYPSFLACSLELSSPIWADLNGWIMAEAQAQARKIGNNNYLPHYFEMEKTIIARADKLSAVSHAQGQALLGELAWAGRLNMETFGYNFVTTIVNGTEDFGEKGDISPELKEKMNSIPADAFVALWLGGYNTWVDEKMLFEGVESAMKEQENLYYLSTGGPLKGLDEGTFARFYEMVKNSPYKERFVFLGWVDTGEIPYIYEKAHIGLNVDKNCVETQTGARNRLNEMMKYGLPAISTAGSEISSIVEECRAGFVVESGNTEALSAALIEAEKLHQEGQWVSLAKNGQKYVKEVATYHNLQKPLLKWLKRPENAPDFGKNVDLSGNKLKMAWQYLKKNGFKKFLLKLRQKL